MHNADLKSLLYVTSFTVNHAIAVKFMRITIITWAVWFTWSYLFLSILSHGCPELMIPARRGTLRLILTYPKFRRHFMLMSPGYHTHGKHAGTFFFPYSPFPCSIFDLEDVIFFFFLKFMQWYSRKLLGRFSAFDASHLPRTHCCRCKNMGLQASFSCSWKDYSWLVLLLLHFYAKTHFH